MLKDCYVHGMQRVAGWVLVSAFCLFCAPVARLHAAIACPVYLLDGKLDHDGVSFSFRNKGKLPLQQLSLYCQPAGAAHRTLCHEESGIFYPGTDYTVSFAYPHRGSSVVLSLSAARLSDGSMWMLRRDDLCHPLRVPARHRGKR